jgi:ABC-type Mn2+/Zn2+ transport system ATPase subunit
MNDNVNIRIQDPLFLPHLECDLSFELKPSQIVVITGENGLGKSTLLNRVWRELPDPRKTFIEQQPLDFFYDRTLEELKAILIHSCLHEMDRNRFEYLWEKFLLKERESRYLSQLSGGENQSLKIACALGRGANFFFLDEPFQSLDNNRKIFLKEILEELREEGKAIMLVEHTLNCLPAGCHVLHLYAHEGCLSLESSWIT